MIGLNCMDEKKFVEKFVKDRKLTYPIVFDISEKAKKTVYEDLGCKGGVPVNYIIDRKGRVVDAWYGHFKDKNRARSALKKLGIKLEDQSNSDD